MTQTNQPELGIVESPDLAFALTLMGFGITGGGAFRDAALAIRSHAQAAELPVIIANVAGTGLRAWASRQESLGSRVVVLRTEPDGPIPEGVGVTGVLPLTVNDVMALAGWGPSAHPLGTAVIAPDFTIADVAAYRPAVTVAPPAPELRAAPVLQAAPAFNAAPEFATAAPVAVPAPEQEAPAAFVAPSILVPGDEDVPDWAREEFGIPAPVSAFAKPAEVAATPEPAAEPEAIVEDDLLFPEPLVARVEPVAELAPEPVVEVGFEAPVVATQAPTPPPYVPRTVQPPAVPVAEYSAVAPEPAAPAVQEPVRPTASPVPTAPELSFEDLIAAQSERAASVYAIPAAVPTQAEDDEPIDFDRMVKTARLADNTAHAVATPAVQTVPAAVVPVVAVYVAPEPPRVEYREPLVAPEPVFVQPAAVPVADFQRTPERHIPEATYTPPPVPVAVVTQPHLNVDLTAPATQAHTSTFFTGGQTIISFAGKGGVGKTTWALAMAHRGAQAGLRVALVDMNRGQGDIRSYLRLADQNLPSIYNAAVTGHPEDAVIAPAQLDLARPGLAPLGFAVVLAPPADLADPSMVTAGVYAQVIALLQHRTDLVIIDTQITESRDTSGLIDHLVVPQLLNGAWGLGVTDMSNPGLNNLLARTKDFVTRGVGRERLLLTVNKAPGFGQADHTAIDAAFSAYATFVGAAGDDLGFANQMNVGNIDSANPTIGPAVDAALHRITGRDEFAPVAPRRRSIFGRRK